MGQSRWKKIDETIMDNITRAMKGYILNLDLIEYELKRNQIIVNHICVQKPRRIAVKRNLQTILIQGYRYKFILDEEFKVIGRRKRYE